MCFLLSALWCGSLSLSLWCASLLPMYVMCSHDVSLMWFSSLLPMCVCDVFSPRCVCEFPPWCVSDVSVVYFYCICLLFTTFFNIFLYIHIRIFTISFHFLLYSVLPFHYICDVLPRCESLLAAPVTYYHLYAVTVRLWCALLHLVRVMCSGSFYVCNVLSWCVLSVYGWSYFMMCSTLVFDVSRWCGLSVYAREGGRIIIVNGVVLFSSLGLPR